MSNKYFLYIDTVLNSLKKHYMQEGPLVEKCPIAVQLFGTYVIVMGVIPLKYL